MIWSFTSTWWGNIAKQPHEEKMAYINPDNREESLSLQDFDIDDSKCPLLYHSASENNIQHTNHVSFTSDDLGDKGANSWDSFPSDNKLPAPPTPGLLGINGYDRHQPPPSPGLLSINSVWSELGNSRRSSYTESNESSFRSGSLSNLSSSLSEHLHNLVRAFSSRTERVKASTAVPPTPSTSPEFDANSDALSAISNLEEPQQRTHRIDSFIPGHKPTPIGQRQDEEQHHHLNCGCCKSRNISCKIPKVFEAQSKIYMSWLFLCTLTFMYNAYAVPLRAAFSSRYMNEETKLYWLLCDYVADGIYLLDILVFKPRLTYLVSGLNETDVKKTRKHYIKKSIFKFDVISLMPLDIFYFATGVYGAASLLRLPRLLKIQTFWEFYQRCDQAIRSAHILRIVKTMTYMLFLIHIEACGYYAISEYEGFNKNQWVYDGKGNAYIRCFYLATKTATSIGNNPIPENTLEYVFMTVYWLSGVFVFALLVGQIRDIVESAQRVKALYDKRMETALRYVKNLNLPKEMREKVRVWFIYNWQQQKVLDEKALMDTLPTKLRTDLAIHVHFNTLSKVKLFQDCDKSLLYSLVLKFKPLLYLPGEYVCRKGEIGKEMYIVSQGIVEVVGGPDNSIVVATLKSGGVFGEISLLSVGAEGNRRTADVRVKGFTNLFMLSKADFESAMSEFPEAHKILKKRARKLLKQNAKLKKKESESSMDSKVDVEEIIHPPRPPSRTPKLLQTVLQVMNPKSDVVKKLGTSCDEIHNQENDNSEKEGDKDHQEREKVQSNEQKKVTIQTKNTQEEDKTKKEEEKPPSVEEEKKSLTAAEVEDFYDEILRATEGNPETFHEAVTGTKNPIKRDGTANTDDSIDSGVHVNKTSSSPTSSTKTLSNKDSKESCISETTEPDDTNNNPPQGRVMALLAEFFEDSVHNDIQGKTSNKPGKLHSHVNKPKPPLKPVKGVLKKNDSNITKKPTNHTNKTVQNHIGTNKILDSNKKIDKPEQQAGLLNKPGSKRPNILGMKNVRKITPEIHIDTDHLTKSKTNSDYLTKPNIHSDHLTKPNKNVKKQTVESIKSPKKMTARNKSTTVGSDLKKEDSDIDTMNNSQIEQSIMEILENDEKLESSELKEISKETENHKKDVDAIRKANSIGGGTTNQQNGQKESLVETQNKNHDRRISKIEASISSLSSEIEKADALLRDLCSDDGQDIKVDELTQSNRKNEQNGIPVKQQEVTTIGQKKPEKFTIPAKNQITCSVEVHREKSLTPLDIHDDIITPISLTEWIENANKSLRKRKESSTSSIFHESAV